MSIIERLDLVIGLVDKEAPYSEIKQGLLAMREQLEGRPSAPADKPLPAMPQPDAKPLQEVNEVGRAIIKCLFNAAGGMTPQEIADVSGCPRSATTYNIECLKNLGLIESGGGQGPAGSGQSFGYTLTEQGRQFAKYRPH